MTDLPPHLIIHSFGSSTSPILASLSHLYFISYLYWTSSYHYFHDSLSNIFNSVTSSVFELVQGKHLNYSDNLDFTSEVLNTVEEFQNGTVWFNVNSSLKRLLCI